MLVVRTLLFWDVTPGGTGVASGNKQKSAFPSRDVSSEVIFHRRDLPPGVCVCRQEQIPPRRGKTRGDYGSLALGSPVFESCVSPLARGLGPKCR